jgi:DsbC/DsbD-like thiol-disulfide interchange protein
LPADYVENMNRRFLISSLAILPLVGSARAGVPWTAQLLAGNFDGKSYSAGLYVKLEKNWKTYWRNPGDGGVPPSITAEPNSNLAGMTVEFPLPLRIVDESGTAFGYHDEVLFPIMITPKDIAQPLNLNFSSFFGVCEKVCTPAKFEGILNFSPKSAPTAEAEMIAKWQRLVPKTGSIVKAATVRDKYLRLDLNNHVSDIFVEGPDNFYFGQPEFDLAGTKASLKVAGLKSDRELKGVELRITANVVDQGVEQRVLVA